VSSLQQHPHCASSSLAVHGLVTKATLDPARRFSEFGAGKPLMNSTRTPRDSPRMTSYMSKPLSLGNHDVGDHELKVRTVGAERVESLLAVDGVKTR